jgi:hypothetical protein
MANFSTITITNDESLVHVQCRNVECVFNLARRSDVQGFYCNLKHISLAENGQCMNMELRNVQIEQEDE